MKRTTDTDKLLVAASLTKFFRKNHFWSTKRVHDVPYLFSLIILLFILNVIFVRNHNLVHMTRDVPRICLREMKHV